jgi:CheY-like chemotaxis protein
MSVKASTMDADSVVIDFDISDTGPRIPREELEDGGLEKEEIQLWGLSLPVVRKRLIGMGGSLTFGSNPGGAFELRLSLPMKLAPGTARSNDPEPARAASRLRLLVAEDSNESFALFRVYVKDEGHEVSRALDGAQALEMVKSGEYDMVVMDIDMPVMDGYTATRAIREWETQQGRPRLPIILLSADSVTRQRGMGASAGCSGYLTKPAPKGAVLQAIHYYASSNAV